MRAVNITGQRFGRLVALRRVCVGGRPSWECDCDCGRVCTRRLAALTSGHTRSCGCLPRRVAEPVATRFWRHVEKSDGCWEWRAHTDDQGYGTMRAGGATRAHRVSWELHRGKVPGGTWVCHACPSRACVNPDHLFLAPKNGRDRAMAAIAEGVAR